MLPLVAFFLLDGSAVDISPILVTSLEVVPSSLLPVGVPAGTYVGTAAGERIPVQGAIAAVALALSLGTSALVASDGYAPAFVASFGNAAPNGTWRAHRIGNRVQVIGALFFTPAVPGVAETITFTLPPSMPPPAPFANTWDLTGPSSCDSTLATLLANVGSTVGALTGELGVKCGAGSVLISVAFGYDAA